MKRYENMSKEEIIEIYCKLDLADDSCEDCIAKDSCDRNNSIQCVEEIKNYLNEEVEMIPRAWTFKTAEEARTAFMENCNKQACRDCKYHPQKNNGVPCYFSWLYEEVGK